MCIVKFEVLGSQTKKTLLSIVPISDPQITLNRSECVKKMIEMRSKVLNIETNFVVFKNKCMDKSKTYAYSSLEYWVTETYKKMIRNHVRIRSTDHFKQVG